MDNEYFASINEVSKRLSVPAHTLRYWEKQFPVVIRPTTGSGGRRYYRAETVRRLETIKDLLYNRGMTIAGVKKMIRDGALSDTGAPCAAATSPDAMPGPGAGISTADVDVVLSLLRSARDILSDK
ncbi:MAG: MerR family transcriptional regulator [Alphaproteobacteria bacterium]|nr:MerR family transcriptional regulator [Alphaproteobacteria bacterium]